MKSKTKGAWILHHTKKLSGVTTNEFEDIELAGKCGTFLASLAASHEESDLTGEKVNAIAKVSNVKKTEIETIKNILKSEHLIDTGKDGSIAVLGITTSSVLDHTSTIFNNSKPNAYQKAALEISEKISELPMPEKELREEISDKHKLSKDETDDLFAQSEEIGFVDHESADGRSKLYFNGNLFRRDSIAKTQAVLGTLKAADMNKVTEVDELLTRQGCATVEKLQFILGEELFKKLIAIGMYDQNEVSNSDERQVLITKPAAFAKYGDPFEADALDMAKAFVAALYYGMNFSNAGRGSIRSLKYLMKRLIAGQEVGPATAIGQDYSILEYKRVIQLTRHGNSSMYYMTLLKKDIGELALQVLETGDTSEQALLTYRL